MTILLIAGVASLILQPVSSLAQGETAGRFGLLSNQEGGVQYYKDPCRENAFRLIFSFSEDLKGLPREAVRFVDFSPEFEEFLLSTYDYSYSLALYHEKPVKVGNRQIEVSYLAKAATADGFEADMALPDQIEILMIDGDLMKIFDRYNRQCEILDFRNRRKTLINQTVNRLCPP